MSPPIRRFNLPLRRVARVGAAVAVALIAALVSMQVNPHRAEPRAASKEPGRPRIPVVCRAAPVHRGAPRGSAIAVLPWRGYEPHANLAVATSRPWVALTFDDGPSPATTPAILRTLRRFHAHATFFVIGRFAARYPALLRREGAAGDDVANHTLDHQQLTNESGHLRVSRSLLRREIRGGRDAVCRAGLRAPAFLRPPYGRGLFTSAVVAQARVFGERVVGWDVALDRYLLRTRTVDEAVGDFLARVQPGMIILLHDGRVGEAAHTGTLTALSRMLAGLRARGLRAVTLSRLLG